jgi:uncharacterized SAM-binding protein YcdF (DUF218 family)
MDTLIFLISKLVGYALMMETWLALLLAATLLSLMAERHRLALRCASIALTSLILLGTLPIGEFLMRPLEAEYPPRGSPKHVDGIIVLGGVEEAAVSAYWSNPQVNQAAERLIAAAALARQHPEAKIIFTGGSARITHALTKQPALPNVSEQILTSLGLPSERLVWEAASRNTTENARNTMSLVQPQPGQTWLLVTSAFHMGRAIRSFEAAGWTAITPYPVDYRTSATVWLRSWSLSNKLDTLNTAIKEWVGRLAYSILNR